MNINVYDFIENYARNKCLISCTEDLLNFYKNCKQSNHLRKFMLFDDVKYGRIAIDLY